MRVIGGAFRSRVLSTPAGNATRPTSDRLRETLFNVLASKIEGARFADLYAGSGAIGIEALSRGAESVLFVEQSPAAIGCIERNLSVLGISDQAKVTRRAVEPAMRDAIRHGTRFDLVFLDPPYQELTEYLSTLKLCAGPHGSLLARGAIAIAEHARKTELPEQAGSLRRYRVLVQGDAALSFYRAEEADVEA